MYCSSSAPEAIHHTTHWSRVLHHNGGPNQYKSRVPCVVCCFQLRSREEIGRRSVGERSSCAPQCSNLKGFAGTRNPTFDAPGRGALELILRQLTHQRSAVPMYGNPRTNAGRWAAWPARAAPPAQEDLNPALQAARASPNAAGRAKISPLPIYVRSPREI